MKYKNESRKIINKNEICISGGNDRKWMKWEGCIKIVIGGRSTSTKQNKKYLTIAYKQKTQEQYCNDKIKTTKKSHTP